MTPTPLAGSTGRTPRLPCLQHAPFVRYLLSRVTVGLAIQVQSVSVGWQIYEISRNPLDLGLAGLAQFLPYIPLVLVSGAVADRYSRKTIIVICALMQAACAALLGVGVALDIETTWPIFLVLVAFGATRAFATPAQLGLIPHLVPAKDFSSAMALNSAIGRAAVVTGPVIGGVVYSVSPLGAYLVALALFLVAALLASLIPRPPSLLASGAMGARALFAGFAHVWREKMLLGLILLDLVAVLFGGVTALMPVYASDILHVGPEGLGLLMAAPAIGALPIALYLGANPIRRNAGVTMLVSVAMFGVFIAIFGISTVFWISFAALMLAGAGDMISVCIRQTLLQTWTPDGLRGRVNAVNGVFTGASNELGAFRAGTFAVLMGAIPTVVFGGIATIVLTLTWTRLFPGLRKVDSLDPLP